MSRDSASFPISVRLIAFKHHRIGLTQLKSFQYSKITSPILSWSILIQLYSHFTLPAPASPVSLLPKWDQAEASNRTLGRLTLYFSHAVCLTQSESVSPSSSAHTLLSHRPPHLLFQSPNCSLSHGSMPLSSEQSSLTAQSSHLCAQQHFVSIVCCLMTAFYTLPPQPPQLPPHPPSQ